MYSVITPVYGNSESIPSLISAFQQICALVRERFKIETEFIFVVDASPDDSYEKLCLILPSLSLNSQILLHSRNFGSFAAIRTGLGAAEGEYFGIIAADLQEPPELLLEFLQALHKDEYDVVVGARTGREDPWLTCLSANLFWRFYRRWVVRELPPGGVDIFGCNRPFRDELLKLKESNSSLIALIYWLGFRRKEVTYRRLPRRYGKSGWSLSQKLKYLSDSIFSFTDLPVRILSALGLIGIGAAVIFAALVTILHVLGQIEVPGYSATVIAITFFGGLNTLGLGLVGSYAWRAFENTKRRPLSVVRRRHKFQPRKSTISVESEPTL